MIALPTLIFCITTLLSSTNACSYSDCPTTTIHPFWRTPDLGSECAEIGAKRTRISLNGVLQTDAQNFFKDCKAGSVDFVQSKIKFRPSLATLGDASGQILGQTCLSLAVYENHLPLVDELLATSKASLNARDWKDYTSLMWAARRGLDEMVEKLIKAGAEINAISHIQIDHDDQSCTTTSRSVTALDWAIYNERKKTIELLKEAGAKCYCFQTEGCDWFKSTKGFSVKTCPEEPVTLA